jgi:dual specificity MAP kinase phosphatase
MPTTILNGFLYLGSYDTASRQELLKAMGITHILNVSSVQGVTFC